MRIAGQYFASGFLVLTIAGCTSELPATGGGSSAVVPPNAATFSDAVIATDMSADSEEDAPPTDAEGDGGDDGELGNATPIIESLTLSADPVPIGEPFTVTAVWTDPDGVDDVETATWTVDLPDTWFVQAQTDTTVTILAPTEPATRATVTLNLRDSANNRANDSIAVQTEGMACAAGQDHCDDDLGTCYPISSGVSASCAATSCLEARMARRDEALPDGLYWLQQPNEPAATEVMCDMTTLGGGWTRIVSLDRGANDACPGEWDGTAEFCRRHDNDQSSAEFPTALAWQQVMGRAVVAPKDSVDAFNGGGEMIDEDYVDGVSFTTGMPRRHLFTVAASRAAQDCPCNNGSAAQDWVGSAYACAAAESDGNFGTDDLLFFGDGFSPRSCDVNGPRDSTFVALVDGPPNNSAVEVRLISAEDRTNESVAVRELELWVREAEWGGDTVDNDYDGVADEIGSSQGTAGSSCAAIKNADPTALDGAYWIDPTGSAPLRVWCDMTTLDGGWTLAAVCRWHDGSCLDAAALRAPRTPFDALSAKLDDDAIRTLLGDPEGDGRSLAVFRQAQRGGAESPRTEVVINRFTDPSAWASDQCGAANKEFFVRSAGADDVARGQVAALVEAASTATERRVITADDADCCAANGWSNLDANECSGAAWFTDCESGPSLSTCDHGDDEPADVLLWIK